MNALLIQKGEDIDYRPKAASTLFSDGYFISYDGLGGVIPAQSADLYGEATPILGVILRDVVASDPDFAQASMVPFQYAHGFKFRVKVGTGLGTAVASMVGSTFDVDGTNPANIDLSQAGTQLTVTAVISTDEVEVEAALVEQEG